MEKKKFFVEVNRKYIVSVESTSNGGAEHVVLDNIPFVKSALAYDEKMWKTDMFVNTLVKCEITNLEDLKLKAQEAYNINILPFKDLALASIAQIAECEKELEELKKRLAEVEEVIKEERELIEL